MCGSCGCTLGSSCFERKPWSYVKALEDNLQKRASLRHGLSREGTRLHHGRVHHTWHAHLRVHASAHALVPRVSVSGRTPSKRCTFSALRREKSQKQRLPFPSCWACLAYLEPRSLGCWTLPCLQVQGTLRGASRGRRGASRGLLLPLFSISI